LVQAAFERKEDADRVGKALLARRSGGYPGGASQRTFEFGADVCTQIIEMLEGRQRSRAPIAG
jgi:hypothetical protein